MSAQDEDEPEMPKTLSRAIELLEEQDWRIAKLNEEMARSYEICARLKRELREEREKSLRGEKG